MGEKNLNLERFLFLSAQLQSACSVNSRHPLVSASMVLRRRLAMEVEGTNRSATWQKTGILTDSVSHVYLFSLAVQFPPFFRVQQ